MFKFQDENSVWIRNLPHVNQLFSQTKQNTENKPEATTLNDIHIS